MVQISMLRFVRVRAILFSLLLACFCNVGVLAYSGVAFASTAQVSPVSAEEQAVVDHGQADANKKFGTQNVPAPKLKTLKYVYRDGVQGAENVVGFTIYGFLLLSVTILISLLPFVVFAVVPNETGEVPREVGWMVFIHGVVFLANIYCEVAPWWFPLWFFVLDGIILFGSGGKDRWWKLPASGVALVAMCFLTFYVLWNTPIL